MTPSNPIPSNSRNSNLKWFGTVLSNGNDAEFLIAAVTRIKCLNAARLFNPQVKAELIQPVTLRARRFD